METHKAFDQERTMYFDEEFLKSLPDDWTYAVPMIIERYQERMPRDAANSVGDANSRMLMQEFTLLLKAYCRKQKLTFLSLPALTPNDRLNDKNIRNVIDTLNSHVKKETDRRSEKKRIKHYENVFEIALENAFHYEFSEGDLKRVQKLINELRDLINASQEFNAGHRRRVLIKLEKLQSELHKTVSDLSEFWGDLIEVSVVARIIGENAKPIIDRIREIIGIVGPAQARAFGLPSDTPFRLPEATDDETS